MPLLHAGVHHLGRGAPSRALSAQDREAAHLLNVWILSSGDL